MSADIYICRKAYSFFFYKTSHVLVTCGRFLCKHVFCTEYVFRNLLLVIVAQTQTVISAPEIKQSPSEGTKLLVENSQVLCDCHLRKVFELSIIITSLFFQISCMEFHIPKVNILVSGHTLHFLAGPKVYPYRFSRKLLTLWNCVNNFVKHPWFNNPKVSQGHKMYFSQMQHCPVPDVFSVV